MTEKTLNYFERQFWASYAMRHERVGPWQLPTVRPCYTMPKGVTVTITRKGKVQSITTYDPQGRKDVQIDIWHSHDGLKPHAHDRDDHTKGRPLSQQEELLLKYALKKWSEHGQRV